MLVWNDTYTDVITQYMKDNKFTEHHNVIYTYHAKMKIFKDKLVIRDYKFPLIAKRKGYEKANDDMFLFSRHIVLNSIKEHKIQSLRLDNLFRSKRMIRDLIDNNKTEFKTFLTLTFADEITDIKQAVLYYKQFYDSWYHYFKKQGRQLKLIGVPEFQKNGRIHYHLLTNIELDKDIPYKSTKRVKGKNNKLRYMNYYDIPFWNYGYSFAEQVEDLCNRDTLSNYLVKYLLKDLSDRFFYNHKYLATRNLDRPKEFKIAKDIENDFLYDFCIEQIEKEFQLLNEYEYTPNCLPDKVFIEKSYRIDDKDKIQFLFEYLVQLSKAKLYT